MEEKIKAIAMQHMSITLPRSPGEPNKVNVLKDNLEAALKEAFMAGRADAFNEGYNAGFDEGVDGR